MSRIRQRQAAGRFDDPYRTHILEYSIRPLLLTSVALLGFVILSEPAVAEYPSSYTVLRVPSPPHHLHHHHPPKRGVREGYVNPKMRQSYAYGWFGARGGSRWTRHFGYYGKFTQWSRR